MAARHMAAIARPIVNSKIRTRAFATVVDRAPLSRGSRAGLTVQQQSDVQEAEPQISEKKRRSLLDPPPKKVTKRPHSRKQPPTLGLGGRVPPLPDPERAQKIYFPNFNFVLCRNGPAHAKDPYTATFLVPKQLTKPDIVAFLTQVYDLKVVGIRTTIEAGTVQNANQLERARNGALGLRTLRKGSKKKAIIQMESPFWYPRRRDPSFFHNQFDTDLSQSQRARALLRAGNREKPGFDGHSHRFRGRSPYLKTVLKGTQKRRRAHERAIRTAIPEARTADVAEFERRLDKKYRPSSTSENATTN